MTVVTVDDLHVATDPRARLARAAHLAQVDAGSDIHRLLVRAPDRQTDGVRVLTLEQVAGMLRRHGRVSEIGVTDGGTIVAAADLCRRRGEIAIWTGQAIGAWHPSDITERGLGGSETAAVRLAEQLAEMGYVVTLFGHFDQEGLCGDVMLRRYDRFDPSEQLDALIGFRDARLFDHRPKARFCCLWLEDLAPAEGLTAARAANVDRIYGVSAWHARQILEVHPWLEQSQVSAGRNGIVLEWFKD